MRWFKKVIAVAVLSMSTALAGVGATYGEEKVVRIGFQKYGKLVLLKNKGTLEDKLKAAGYKVVWTEFPSGPPLLEALNVGAIDFGNTGEAPPIFAQAAGAPIRYVAYEPPAPKGEAILVPKDSKLASVETALKRQAYGIKPITDSVIAAQQQVADTFFALGLLPKQVKISDAARRPGT
jgi:sulfonate transport system substrate-binding protein